MYLIGQPVCLNHRGLILAELIWQFFPWQPNHQIKSPAKFSRNTVVFRNVIPSNFQKCLASNLQWSHVTGIQSPSGILCPALSNPVDGEVQVTSRVPGGSAVYLCNAGFTLNGSLVRGCGNDGMWISDEPTCDRKDKISTCHSPHTHIHINSECSYSHRNRSMMSHYHIQTHAYTYIANSDTVTCPVLLQGSLQNGILEISTTTVGSVASYVCSLGYLLDGPDRRQCQSNGTWTGNDPACNREYTCWCHMVKKSQWNANHC